MARCRHNGRPPTRLYDPAPLMVHVSHLSNAQAGWWLGIDPARVSRYRSGKKWLQYTTADRLALRLNLHPTDVWPDFGKPCCSLVAPDTLKL